MNENMVQSPKVRISNSLGDLIKIVRVAKLRLTYLQGVSTLGLKTIDFSTVRKKKILNEKKHLEEMEKLAKGNEFYRNMMKIFNIKYKQLTGRNFQFKKRRIVTRQNLQGQNKVVHVESDAKRLSSIFKQIQSVSDNMKVISRIIEEMMEKWSDWDKADSFNLIGFLSSQCGDELGTYAMKAKKKSKVDKTVVLKEDKRVENVEKHRMLFAS